jgi:hypothetical protein
VVVAIPHAVPIPAAAGRSIVASLSELTVDGLDGLVRAR